MIELVNKKTIAKQCSTTPAVISQLVKKRLIPFTRLGYRTLRFSPSAVEEAIKKLEVKVAA